MTATVGSSRISSSAVIPSEGEVSDQVKAESNGNKSLPKPKVVKWLYAVWSLVLITTDFLRSSWFVSELIGAWKPSSAQLMILNGKALFGEGHAPFLSVLEGVSGHNESESVFRVIYEGTMSDSEYDFYHQYQPNDEFGRHDMLSFFKEYTHDPETEELYEELKSAVGGEDAVVGYYSASPEQSFQVSYCSPNVISEIHFDSTLYVSNATSNNASDSIYHDNIGIYRSMPVKGRVGNVEIYEFSLIEENGVPNSVTDGVPGRLYKAIGFIQLTPTHFIADGFRLCAFAIIVSIALEHARCKRLYSIKGYRSTLFSLYDLITGNRIVAICMGIASLLDMDATMNVIIYVSYYALFSWRLFPIYICSMYSFRFFWIFNGVASLYGLIEKYLDDYKVGRVVLRILGLFSLHHTTSAFKNTAALMAVWIMSVHKQYYVVISEYFYDLEELSGVEICSRNPQMFFLEIVLVVSVIFSLLSYLHNVVLYSRRGLVSPHNFPVIKRLRMEGLIASVPVEFMWLQNFKTLSTTAQLPKSDNSFGAINVSANFVIRRNSSACCV